MLSRLFTHEQKGNSLKNIGSRVHRNAYARF